MRVRGFVLGLSLVTAVSACSSSTQTDSKVSMPNFVQLPLDRASVQAAALGIKVTAKDATESRDVLIKNNWIVVRQDPAPGQLGSAVTLYVSRRSDLAPKTSAAITTR
jgi:beta-lactam-binding protein with PASTA domain